MNFDLELDARGLMCPLPLLRLKKALVGMNSGQIVRVQVRARQLFTQIKPNRRWSSQRSAKSLDGL